MSSRKAFCELTEGFHELTEGLFIFRELMEGVSVWKICMAFMSSRKPTVSSQKLP